MGLFDSLFGSKSEESSTSESEAKKKALQVGTQDTTKTGTQATTVDSSTVGQTDTVQTGQETTDQKTIGESISAQDTKVLSTTTNLDQGTQDILTNLIGGLSGDLKEGGGSIIDSKVLEASAGNLDFAKFLQDRAVETENVLNANTGAIVGEARRQGENALEAQGTRLAAGAGSNLNSIVQAAQAQGRSDLETQLAGLSANLGIQAREAGSSDLATAFGAGNEGVRTGADVDIAGKTAGTDQITSLVNALSGATQTTVGETSVTGKQTDEQTLTAIINSLQNTGVTSQEDTTLAQVTETEEQTSIESLLAELSLINQSGSSTGEKSGAGSPFDFLIDFIGAFPDS